MNKIDKQAVIIKFCFSNSKTAEETFKMMQTAYGDDNTMTLENIQEKYKQLENDAAAKTPKQQDDVEDKTLQQNDVEMSSPKETKKRKAK